MDNGFTYQGDEYPFFCHLYNMTWLTERCVEVAITHRWLTRFPPSMLGDGLEVGNVLGHYQHRTHQVYDLYETRSWYQEQDVANIDLLGIPEEWRTFPWVVSLSTIEHTDDPVRAIGVLKRLVAPGGGLLVSFPTGYHEGLDGNLPTLRAEFDTLVTLARTRDGWAQTDDLVALPYGPWANSVAIGEWANAG